MSLIVAERRNDPSQGRAHFLAGQGGRRNKKLRSGDSNSSDEEI